MPHWRRLAAKPTEVPVTIQHRAFDPLRRYATPLVNGTRRACTEQAVRAVQGIHVSYNQKVSVNHNASQPDLVREKALLPMPSQSKHVSLFLVDGTFGGIVTAEIMNWTGHLLKGQRAQLSTICNRPEAQRAGVYILLGEDDKGPLAYIGQTDCIAQRLKQHNAAKTGKDFWHEVVFATSKDANLTSAHVRYLESQLVKRAKETGRMRLTNADEPSGGAELPEADQSDMIYFIRQLLTLLPVLGVDFLRGRTMEDASLQSPSSQSNADAGQTDGDSPVFELSVQKTGVAARAQVIDGEFTVLADSIIAAGMRAKTGSKVASSSTYVSMQALFEQYRDDGTIVINPDKEPGTARLTRNVQFTSPSSAAAFVQGHGTANGRTAWKTENGTITYEMWESSGND